MKGEDRELALGLIRKHLAARPKLEVTEEVS